MKHIFSRVRFLPITIFAATLMLTVKIGDIVDGIGALPAGAISVGEAEAQTSDLPLPGQEARPEAPSAQQAAVPSDQGSMPGGSPKPEASEDGPSKLVTEDPTLLTLEEIDLLQQLAERREALERREQEFEIRAGLLAAAETRIDRKIAELKSLELTITDLVKTFDEQQESKLKSLVKIYENMKPKDAARIFEDLELDTLLEVAQRMKERKLAPIMAKMNPEKAREMTVELRTLRELPTVGDQTGG